MGFLSGKRVLIVGVASKLSIASGIAAAMHREGAELAFTYQNEKLKGRVEDFAAGVPIANAIASQTFESRSLAAPRTIVILLHHNAQQ